MNIKVITRHAPSNYGSLLQAFATIKILNRLGHHTQIIDSVSYTHLTLPTICSV